MDYNQTKDITVLNSWGKTEIDEDGVNIGEIRKLEKRFGTLYEYRRINLCSIVA